jgi:hypothetical protein
MIFWLTCVENLRLVIIELKYLEGFWFLLEDSLKIIIFAW